MDEWDENKKHKLLTDIQRIESDLDAWLKGHGATEGMDAKNARGWNSVNWRGDDRPWDRTVANTEGFAKRKTLEANYDAAAILDKGPYDDDSAVSRYDISNLGAKLLSNSTKKVQDEKNEEGEIIPDSGMNITDLIEDLHSERGGIYGFESAFTPKYADGKLEDSNKRKFKNFEAIIDKRLYHELNPNMNIEIMRDIKLAKIGDDISTFSNNLRNQDENYYIEEVAKLYPEKYLDYTTKKRAEWKQYFEENPNNTKPYSLYNYNPEYWPEVNQKKYIKDNMANADINDITSSSLSDEKVDDRWVQNPFYQDPNWNVRRFNADPLFNHFEGGQKSDFRKWRKNRDTSSLNPIEPTNPEEAPMVLSPKMRETLVESVGEIGKRREDLLSSLQFTLNSLKDFT